LLVFVYVRNRQLQLAHVEKCYVTTDQYAVPVHNSGIHARSVETKSTPNFGLFALCIGMADITKDVLSQVVEDRDENKLNAWGGPLGLASKVRHT
jgi:hypothetical protein